MIFIFYSISFQLTNKMSLSNDTDCSQCPGCLLRDFIENHIDTLSEEEFEHGFAFTIPSDTWKHNKFTKDLILNLPTTFKRYKVKHICVKYNRSRKYWEIDMEFSGF